jgi:hypothetical protein
LLYSRTGAFILFICSIQKHCSFSHTTFPLYTPTNKLALTLCCWSRASPRVAPPSSRVPDFPTHQPAPPPPLPCPPVNR